MRRDHALVSTSARVDAVFRGGGPPDLAVLTPLERDGRALFNGRAGCSRCHRTNALDLDLPSNIGLDSVPADTGAGGGRFKTSSLRNVAVRPPYMHDGRFATLEEPTPDEHPLVVPIDATPTVIAARAFEGVRALTP